MLIADDDPISCRLLEVSLARAGYAVSTVANGGEAFRLLELEDGPRLVVLDWMMPEMDGVDVCRAVRKSSREAYIYLILLTARGHQTEIIEGLEAGADDYVTKPCDLHELKARLRAGVRVLELQDQLIVARETLRIQATHDSLTGVLNHGAILSVLEKELTRSDREGNPVAIMMTDIDHFKSVNDTYGHPAGDAVLCETAQRMLSSVRPYDSIGRFGGEEFVLVMPGCDLDMGIKQAERLREIICAQPVRLPEFTIPTTISIGVAAAWKNVQASQLLRVADQALYAAKNAGRNRVAAALK